jgi:hypothetical protein
MVGFSNDVFSSGQVNVTPSSGSTPISISNNGNFASLIQLTNTTSGTDAAGGINITGNGSNSASIALFSPAYTTNTNLTNKLGLTSGSGTSGIAMNVASLGSFQVYESDILRLSLDSSEATFSVPLSVNGTNSGSSYIRLIDTDAGASAGPILDIYRNSASPAASDVIGQIQFNGQDSGTGKELYASITAQIDSATAGSESARITFATDNAGTLTTQLAMLNTGCQVRGNNTNTAPPAGYIGQIISSVVQQGSAVTLTSGINANVTSISLTAGIWDVTFILGLTGGAVTGTIMQAAISANSASFTGTIVGDNRIDNNGNIMPTADTDTGYSIPSYRVTLASTTTYYAVVASAFTVGTLKAYGRLSAVRVG